MTKCENCEEEFEDSDLTADRFCLECDKQLQEEWDEQNSNYNSSRGIK